MLLSVVYRCVDLISNSVAQLPIDLYDAEKRKVLNDLSYVLNSEPNSAMSRFTFIKLMIGSMILRGDAYAWIERDKNDNVLGLHYVDSTTVGIKVVKDDIKQYIYYVVGGQVFESSDMIHLINYTYDGINGVSTIRSAINSIKLAGDSESAA